MVFDPLNYQLLLRAYLGDTGTQRGLSGIESGKISILYADLTSLCPCVSVSQNSTRFQAKLMVFDPINYQLLLRAYLGDTGTQRG